MDHIDRRIIGELAHDGRITVTELASRLPLSVSATAERLGRLRTSGLIRQFTVEVDHREAGRPLRVFVDLRLRRDVQKAAADRALLDVAAVVDAAHVTGRYDYQLELTAKDTADLDASLAALVDEVGAEETVTRLVLRQLDGFPRPPSLT